MLPTPETRHVAFERVYEPAEDSFLLLDTLSSKTEKVFLQARFDSAPSQVGTGSYASDLPPLVAEIGTGSGIVLAFINAHAEAIFGRSDILTVGVDINIHACRATKATVEVAAHGQAQQQKSHGFYMGSIVGDLTTPLRPGLVDVLIFNPPYVPTPSIPALPVAGVCQESPTYDEDSQFLALSYAGGTDGMETTDRLLDLLPGVLSSIGVAYILLAAQNKPEAMKKRIRAWGTDWTAETVASSGKTAGWERLQVIRISRFIPITASATKALDADITTG